MSHLALQNQVEYTLTVLSGPAKGETFKLMATTIQIGRASTNDIVLAKDVKVSRQHAEIHISSAGIIIKSLNKNNLVEVDGQQGEALMLNHNSKVRIGSTKLLFEISMLVKDDSLTTSTNHSELAHTNESAEKELGFTRPQQMPSHTPRTKNKTNHFRMILIGVLILIVVAVLNNQKENLIKGTGIRTDEDVEKEIETINQLREAERKLKSKQGLNSPQFQDAQAHFIKGFRDYKKGKYERALSSFQACSAIFPNHELCNTYKKLAEKKFFELIQFQMIQGKKFLDKGQYQACKSAYKNVMYMVRDNSNKTYQEAEANYMLCKSRMEGRF